MTHNIWNPKESISENAHPFVLKHKYNGKCWWDNLYNKRTECWRFINWSVSCRETLPLVHDPDPISPGSHHPGFSPRGMCPDCIHENHLPDPHFFPSMPQVLCHRSSLLWSRGHHEVIKSSRTHSAWATAGALGAARLKAGWWVNPQRSGIFLILTLTKLSVETKVMSQAKHGHSLYQQER